MPNGISALSFTSHFSLPVSHLKRTDAVWHVSSILHANLFAFHEPKAHFTMLASFLDSIGIISLFAYANRGMSVITFMQIYLQFMTRSVKSFVLRRKCPWRRHRNEKSNIKPITRNDIAFSYCFPYWFGEIPSLFCQGRFRRVTSKSSLDFFLFCVSRTKGSSFCTKGGVCQDRGKVKSGEGKVGAV